MKCPHCQRELGLNNICINVICSHFGTEINSSDNSNLNYTENDLDKKNSYNNNTYNSNDNHNLNNKYDNVNDYSYNRHSYDNNQSINKTTNKSSNIYNNNISIKEFAAFIGDHNTNYYLEHIHKMENNNRFLSWNWPCFFLGPYWLLYRKLYAIALILIVLNISLSLVFHSRISMFLGLPVRIILTIFANAIYLNNSKRKIKTVKTTIANLSTTQYINRLHKKGGVNLVAPLILLAICIIIIIISIVTALLFIARNNPPHFSSPSYHY